MSPLPPLSPRTKSNGNIGPFSPLSHHHPSRSKSASPTRSPSRSPSPPRLQQHRQEQLSPYLQQLVQLELGSSSILKSHRDDHHHHLVQSDQRQFLPRTTSPPRSPPRSPSGWRSQSPSIDKRSRSPPPLSSTPGHKAVRFVPSVLLSGTAEQQEERLVKMSNMLHVSA